MVGGWDYSNEKFDMKVPERILVVGQDQHLGKGYWFSIKDDYERVIYCLGIGFPGSLILKEKPPISLFIIFVL